jgi:hypothetical protein
MYYLDQKHTATIDVASIVGIAPDIKVSEKNFKRKQRNVFEISQEEHSFLLALIVQ